MELGFPEARADQIINVAAARWHFATQQLLNPV